MVFASTQGTTQGSFNIGSENPNVDAFQVYSDSDLTTVANDLTPQVTYYAKITVTDPNTLNDIQTVKVKMFYDADGTDPVESTVTEGNTQTAAIFTWTKATGLWTLDAGTGTTWAIVSASSVTPTMTATTGDWVLAFRVGKVATESVGDANWDLHARVTDGTYLSHSLYQKDKQVLWFGQTNVNTGTVDFGEVEPGTGFADDVNKVGAVQVTCISNGEYTGSMRSAATWTGTGAEGYVADYDSTGACSNPNEFSLKAFRVDDFANAVQIGTTNTVVSPGAPQTTEAGDVHSDITFWLKVASVFQIDVYEGSIHFVISNG